MVVQHSPPAPPEFQTLRLDDFSYFGFDDPGREFKGRIRQVEIRGGTPGVSIVEDTLIVPIDPTESKSAERREIGQTFLDSSGGANELELDEEVIYLGRLVDHFGHFLMQSLARTWFLTEVSPAARVIFDIPSKASGQSPAWRPRILEAFGVPPERIVVLNAPTRIRRLIVPEPLFEPRGSARDHVVRAHEAMARPYQAVAKRLAGDATPSEQPVYLSRRRLPPSQRTIIGEGDLEEVLRANGFRIAHTETMTFEDQVRLVNEHADIFSNAGSAAHNVLFALHQPRLHLLTNHTQFSPDYLMYSTIVGARTSFINCLNTGGRARFERAHKQTPHLLDAPTLMEYLDQHGFLTTPVPDWSPRYRAELQAQYDEAWLYGNIRALKQGATLPEDVEREALSLALTSWPISLALARYYTHQDRQRAESLARQFADLAAAETDADRLARHRAEVADMAPILVRRCSPETAAILCDVAAERFLVALMSKEQLP